MNNSQMIGVSLPATSSVILFPADGADVTPATTANYEAVRFNAMKHGILSRLVVLAHEDHAEFVELLAALIDEHSPAGMTERHLIEELAAIIWRKRRVLQAEGASINKGMKEAAVDAKGVIPSAVPFELGLSGEHTDLRDLMPMTSDEVADQQQDAEHDLEATQKAAEILRRGDPKAFEKALRALRAGSQDWWRQFVEEEEYTPDAEGLAEFIREHLEPFCSRIEIKARHHYSIKAQALGEGLQVYRLDGLTRYETHLDRKFERTLAMLLKLKQFRVAR